MQKAFLLQNLFFPFKLYGIKKPLFSLLALEGKTKVYCR